MHVTMRRYEGIDNARRDELKRKVEETLTPKLSKLPGFGGYFLIDAGDGVMSSIGLFETAAQADESTRVASSWVIEEKLEQLLPNAPKISGGDVLVQKTNGAFRA
jgi:hypothetical protein